jgi:hypothetical protein
MAQKDAQVNIELSQASATLAQATKEDSFAMKTIAVLGMFFLPGTFLAVSTPHFPVGKYNKVTNG